MVTKKPKGLGLGLEALLGPKVSDMLPRANEEPATLKLSQLRPGKYQPRTRMDEGSLYELAQSIKSQGIMQPILVRPLADRHASGLPAYEIIAGERRSRAAQLAGLDEVPVLVKAVNDEAAAVMALIENMQREDLNALEEAQGLQRLINEFKFTHEQAAQAVGRSRSATTNLLRLLQLADVVQHMLVAGDLEMGHARALLALEGAQQVTVAHEVAAKKLSVRETEKLIARSAADRGAAKRGADKPAKSRDLQRMEETLSDLLTASVEIRILRRSKRGEQGEVAIQFASLDELNGLLDKLGVRE